MPLIKYQDGKASLIENKFASLEDEVSLPAKGGICVSLKRFLEDKEMLLQRNEAIGVHLSPDDDALELKDSLDRISLVAISFPKYTDGRGFSQAQLLRRRLHYQGEIRAIGQVLRDQLNYMARCGIDAFEFTPTSGEGPQVLQSAIADFTYAYQRTSGAQNPIFSRRHEQLRS